MGESAEALLVIFTTCPAPARTALAATFSSWAGIAGLTSSTAETPRIAASMVAGTSRSPSATCSCQRQRGSLLRVADQDPGGLPLLSEQSAAAEAT
jgi:hypothetical protein